MTAYKTVYKSTQPVHIMNLTTFLEIVHRIYVYMLKCWVEGEGWMWLYEKLGTLYNNMGWRNLFWWTAGG